MVKEPEYTYSSPNTMWINVVHKYNRGFVIQLTHSHTTTPFDAPGKQPF